MRIVFCTACTDRHTSLEEAVRHNLDLLRGTDHALALCDLGRRDDIGAVAHLHMDDIRRGVLIYFRADRPQDIPFGQALNAAHRLGLRRDPDVLFRLDPGHVITAETLGLVDDTFAYGGNVVLHNWSAGWGDASMGRIAMTAADWIRLGGYDETATGRTWQDFDLLVRARAQGLDYRLSPRSLGVGRPAIVDDRPAEVEGFVRILERLQPPASTDQRRISGVFGLSEPAVL